MSVRNVLRVSKNRLRTTYVLIFALTSFTSGLCYYATCRTADGLTEVVECHNRQEKLARVTQDLRDAESGQRGYLITSDPSYLQPYTEARSHIFDDMTALVVSTDNPDQRRRVQELRVTASARMKVLEDVIALEEHGHAQQATDMVLTGDGKDLMGKCRDLGAEIYRVDSLRTVSRENSLYGTSNRTALSFGILVPLTFMSLMLAQRSIGRRFDETEAAVSGLEESGNRLLKELGVQQELTLQSGRRLEAEVSERVRAEEELVRETAFRQKFLVDVLYSVTDGKFRLCGTKDELPGGGDLLLPPMTLTPEHLGNARHMLIDIARAMRFRQNRVDKITSASGEAMMNAVVHGGNSQVTARMVDGAIHVTVTDDGHGIDLDKLPSSVLHSGFSSLGRKSMGVGFTIILSESDQVYLHTGMDGTDLTMVFCESEDPISRFESIMFARE